MFPIKNIPKLIQRTSFFGEYEKMLYAVMNLLHATAKVPSLWHSEISECHKNILNLNLSIIKMSKNFVAFQ